MTESTTQLSGDRSRERHAKESAASAGAVSHVSREVIRQCKFLATHHPEMFAEVKADRLTVGAAYREAKGDDRRPLYMRLDPSLDDDLRAFAHESGMTRQGFVAALLESFFTDAYQPEGNTA